MQRSPREGVSRLSTAFPRRPNRRPARGAPSDSSPRPSPRRREADSGSCWPASSTRSSWRAGTTSSPTTSCPGFLHRSLRGGGRESNPPGSSRPHTGFEVRGGSCRRVWPHAVSCCPVQVSSHVRALWCCPVTLGDASDVCKSFAARGQMPGDFFLQGLGSARVRHDVLPIRQERPGKRCGLSARREGPSPRDREVPGVSLRPRRPERRGRGARDRARGSRGRPSPLSNRHPGSPRGPPVPRASQARRSPRRALRSHRPSSGHRASPGPDRGRSQAQAARIPRPLPAGLGPAHP